MIGGCVMGERFVCDTFFSKKQNETGKNNRSINWSIDLIFVRKFSEKLQQTHPTLSIDRKKCPKFFLDDHFQEFPEWFCLVINLTIKQCYSVCFPLHCLFVYFVLFVMFEIKKKQWKDVVIFGRSLCSFAVCHLHHAHFICIVYFGWRRIEQVYHEFCSDKNGNFSLFFCWFFQKKKIPRFEKFLKKKFSLKVIITIDRWRQLNHVVDLKKINF